MTRSTRQLRQSLLMTIAGVSFFHHISMATAQDAEGPSELPPVTVEQQTEPEEPAADAAPKPKPVAQPQKRKPVRAAAKPKARRKAPPAPAPQPAETYEPAEAAASDFEAEGTASIAPTTSTTGFGRGGPSGVDGYQATRSLSATKTNTPLRDVPQAATVVTKELAKDQGSRDLNQALRYVPGVHVQQGEGHRDAVTIRGQSSTADFFTDGVRDDVQYYRDIYNVDVIEVLKGPNAMIFGRGGGGGVVNRVTKKAEFETIREASVTFGSFDTKRVTIDAGGAGSRDFAFRLNSMYEDSGGFRDYYELERFGFNPTATARLSEQTTLRVSYEFFKDDRTVDRGIPSYRGLGPAGTADDPLRPSRPSRSAFFGDPRDSYSEFNAHIATATLEHEFDNGMKLRNHMSYGDYDKFYGNVYASSPVVGAPGAETFNISAYTNDTDRQSFFNQTDLTMRLDHGNGLAHTVVAGVEIGYQDTRQFRFNGTIAGGNVVPYRNPTVFRDVTYNVLNGNAINDTELQTTSVYIQDQFEIGKHWQIIGGLRYERFDLDYTNAFNGASFGRVDEEWSPRLGVVFKPVESVSLYASYAKSFLPSSGDQFATLNAATADLSPEEFTNYEIGFKMDVLPRLAFAGALYRLDRENTSVTIGPGVTAQVGKTETEGGELSLTGYLTDKWQIAAGYGYQDAVIANAGATGNTNNHVPQAPKHLFSLWNRYQFLDWFGAGLGVIHSTEFYPSADNTTIVPGYTRLDAAMFFKINENFDAQINIENVLDETYFSSAHNNNNLSYGAPRSAYVTLTGRF